MAKKILILGSSGKMGVALRQVLGADDDVIGKNSRDFDAADFQQVRSLIKENKPDMVINTVALLGIDPCEKEPQKAFLLNTLYPKLLAELSNENNFLLVHFSTDAVFNDRKNGYYTEADSPQPLNIYGLTKYAADCLIQAIAKRYYIFRIPLLFGETTKNTQFVEKMLQKVNSGEKVLRISRDIFSSPTYSYDAAQKIKEMLKVNPQFGLYHLSNAGTASLYELMQEIITNLNFNVRLEAASYKDFPFIGLKNTFTPIKSGKIRSLRPWQEAVKEYCSKIKDKLNGD